MFNSKKILILFLGVLLVALIVLFSCLKSNPYSKVVGDYDTTKLGCDFGGGEAYSIGVNFKGMPIFKDPNKAYEQAIKDYKEGFQAISKEYNLWKINKFNYKSYGTYGWQLTTGSDEAKEQGLVISKFFDIYENSYR